MTTKRTVRTAADVDEQLDRDHVAALLGIRSETVSSYVSQARARTDVCPFPAPDGRIGASSWWYRSTIEKWRDGRPGTGGNHARPSRFTVTVPIDDLPPGVTLVVDDDGRVALKVQVDADTTAAAHRAVRESVSRLAPRLDPAGPRATTERVPIAGR